MDPRPRVPAIGKRGQQVLANFGFHAPLTVAGGAQLTDGARQILGLAHHSTLRLNPPAHIATRQN
ncbi:hypothetical protein A5664_01245 [Mycolicibacterium fortuitum]|nr:hypothetical protein A5664_01245 [Mycolicibacterium fortuitum]